MRTVIYTFDGAATVGDLILVSYRHPRGGQSTAKCVIGDPATPDIMIGDSGLRRNFKKALNLEDACRVLADEINSATSEWCPGTGDFKAVAKGKRLTVMSSTLVNDVTFHCDFEGAKTETCDIEVL